MALLLSLLLFAQPNETFTLVGKAKGERVTLTAEITDDGFAFVIGTLRVGKVSSTAFGVIVRKDELYVEDERGRIVVGDLRTRVLRLVSRRQGNVKQK